jgi:DNA-binding beta-propeller fold protein YncE
MKKSLLLQLNMFVAIFICSITFAHATLAKFDIEPTTKTNVNVPINSSTIVQYSITNNTKITRTLTLLPIQISGVTTITDNANACGNIFTLAPHNTCFQTFKIDGSLIPSSSRAIVEVCKTIGNGNNQPDNLLCSKSLAANALTIRSTDAFVSDQAIYVTNEAGNSISLCYIAPITGVLKNCNIAAANDVILAPEAVAMNPARTILYVANVNGSVAYCQINSQTGALSACQNTGNNFSKPDGIVITPDNAYAYVSNITSNSVSVCTVDATSGALSGCTPTGFGFDIPSDIAINSAGTHVYVTNFNNSSIVPCEIGSGGLLTCTTATNGFFNPEGITLLDLPTGVTKAYVTNFGNNTVSFCTVSGASITDCKTTDGTFVGLGNIGFNSAGTTGYLPSSALSVSKCTVNSTTGELSDCTDSSGDKFRAPAGVLTKSL